MDRGLPESKRLQQNVEWALSRALDPATVLPMLHRLSRIAKEGSDESIYAQRRLAELLADHHPWRAALAAKRVLASQPTDDGAWAILALCHSLLGNYHCASDAYGEALALAPKNAAYAHNLGHLLDVALDRPKDAVQWLRVAYVATHRRADVAVSFAHALGRAGEIDEAREVSRRALKTADPSCLREHVALAEWLKDGQRDERGMLHHGVPVPAAVPSWATRRRRKTAAASDTPSLEETVTKGLTRLPLNAEQCTRATTLAREPSALQAAARDGRAHTSVAAAIAYAIVYVDQIPLTQAEVAACFRVSVPALRGQWKALRGRIELAVGGARVASERPR